MADKTITALTGASTPLAGTEVLPIVQSGATVKVATNDLTVRNVRANATTGILQVVGPTAATTRVMTTPDANFTAARTDAAQSFTGDQTLATGNLIPGTAAKGINFTANTPAAGMTSQLLNWYEEGTWTAAFASGGGSITIDNAYKAGAYTKIGRQITLTGYFIVGSVSSPTGNFSITGLPYAASGASQAFDSSGGLYLTQTNAFTGYPFISKQAGTSTILIQYTDALGNLTAAASLFKAGTEIKISLTYFTA